MSTPESKTPPRTFGTGRRLSGVGDFILSFFLALYVLLLWNIIVFRHPVRLDLTRDRIHTLSQATLDRLELVREEMDRIVPELRPGRQVVQLPHGS